MPAFPGLLGKFLSVPGGREYLVQVPGSVLSGLSDEAVDWHQMSMPLSPGGKRGGALSNNF
ncbi:hypothetical protein [Pseudomonas sp. SCB32]|uniref:hypothetical protein n=1 Tax=Pseudomonas sp. SCB32 TaxID=2653853 RepID=UPI001263F349|nr:hypothetical protein [Pseudomonas sp. SCB32]